MKVVFDIEANALKNPTEIWVIVCKDIDTGEYHIFRNVTSDQSEREKFHEYVPQVTHWIGHNILEYDYPVLASLLDINIIGWPSCAFDTLIASRLVNYSRPGGHSIESYGTALGLEKITFRDFSKFTIEMEDYCARDVDICHSVYDLLNPMVNMGSLLLEQNFQLVLNDMRAKGFAFNTKEAERLLGEVKEKLNELDSQILQAFPPRLIPVREIQPRLTRYGTLNKSDFRWLHGGDLSEFNGGPFTRCEWRSFNPASHKQVVEVLTRAGWSPTDKTGVHKDTERALNRQKYLSPDKRSLDIAELSAKLERMKVTGWKINEINLSTLPPSAPKPAKLLAQRILYESRRRTLVEWLECVSDDSRIHGKFQGIGAWTHRMAHQEPNMANIPSAQKEDGSVKLLGKEMRSLWRAPRNRLLVGVDAEGIQLRIFAHYINDPEFTYALTAGKKSDQSDPHSLNQRILGSACRSRQAAKRFIYALLLGAGLEKLSSILGTTELECKAALDRLLTRYTGFRKVKEEIIPQDARRGYFIGIDGRRVLLPGETMGQRKHLCMSGYLQSGEAIVIKETGVRTERKLRDDFNRAFLVDIVHDEFVIECRNSIDDARNIIRLFKQTIVEVGESFGLNCPLAGAGDYGLNWFEIH